MNGIKILVADSTDDFCAALSQTLQGQYRVRACQEGTQALEMLCTFLPDILILDMMLPGLDGITLLQRAAQRGIHPHVIATTNYFSDYMAEAASRFQVCYMMRKPCSAEACAARITDITQHLSLTFAPKADLRAAAANVLIHLGVPAKLKGYGYLREGIVLFSRDVSQPVTKELYPAVAGKFGCTGEQVERAIRGAIQNAYKSGDNEAWRVFFPECSRDEQHCPTNSEFIARLTAALMLEENDAPSA